MSVIRNSKILFSTSNTWSWWKILLVKLNFPHFPSSFLNTTIQNEKDVAFIQGQATSNSSSSSSVSTVGASSQQQLSDAHKSSNNMDSSESTPNLTHATRVSPATVRIEIMYLKGGKTIFLFPFVGVGGREKFSIFFFILARCFCHFCWGKRKSLTLKHQLVSSLSDFRQQQSWEVRKVQVKHASILFFPDGIFQNNFSSLDNSGRLVGGKLRDGRRSKFATLNVIQSLHAAL